MELRSHFTVCELSDVSNRGRGICAAAPYLLLYLTGWRTRHLNRLKSHLMSISRLRLRKRYGVDLTLKLQLTTACTPFLHLGVMQLRYTPPNLWS